VQQQLWSTLLVAGLVLGSTVTSGLGTSVHTAHALTQTVIDPHLADRVGAMLDTEQVKVVLTYANAPSSQDLQALRALGLPAGKVLRELPMVILSVNKHQLTTLLNSSLSNVTSIYSDQQLEYFMDQSVAQIGAEKNRTTSSMGFSGRGVGVAVLDSGIDATHPDLQFGTRVVQNVKVVDDIVTDYVAPTYVENVPDSDNAGGHGTHCAATVGGDGTASGGKYAGVAPGADLIGISAGATILITSALEGLDYVLTHQYQYNIQVVSNSWGSTGAFDPNNPINIATKRLHDRGVTVLFAAGNEGPSANTQNPYSVAPWVIAVGAGNKQTGTLADFSSRGIRDDALYHPTVVAPGVDIISAKAKQSVLAPLSAQQDLELIPTQYQPYYTTMSGTSMATPHVAGVVALLEEANPHLTPDQAKQILMNTATKMPGYSEFEVGKGYVNAYAAIDQVQHPERAYGALVNQTYKAAYQGTVDAPNAQTADWSPTAMSTFTFDVGANALVSDLTVSWADLANLLSVRLTRPDGTVTTTHASPLSAVYGTQLAIALDKPQAGTYKLEVLGARGTMLGVPDTVQFNYRTYYGTFGGLTDIAGHAYEGAIRTAVAKRLYDAVDATTFKPDQTITKGELARWIASDFEIRQNLTRSVAYSDVPSALAPFVAAVTSDAAPMRDIFWTGGNVLSATSATKFGTNESVTRAQLAKALVKSFGLDAEAQQQMNTRTAYTDDATIPADARGYVVVATERGLLQGYVNGSNIEGTTPTYSFRPQETITRGAFAHNLVTAHNVFMQ